MKEFRLWLQYLTISVMALLNSACLLDSGTPGAAVAPGATVSVSITSPAASQIDTVDETMTIAGTAESASIISSVAWQNDRGGEGMANGTDNWQSNNIPLVLGANNITVTATNIDGGSASTSIVINRESEGQQSVTLSWTPPTRRTDGTILTDLAGYRIHYGRMSETYDFLIDIDNPGIQTLVVENLSAGVWYFAASAYDADGLESDYSNEAVFTLQ